MNDQEKVLHDEPDQEESIHNENEDEEVEMSPEEEDASLALKQAKEDLIRNVYGSIDYEALFTFVGQPECYKEFRKYVDMYETLAKEKSEKGEKIDPPKAWHDFLSDAVPVKPKSVGRMTDMMINMIVHISIFSAQVINGTIYDKVISSQFINVQTFFENIAGTIGAMAKKIDDLDKQINSNNESTDNEAEGE